MGLLTLGAFPKLYQQAEDRRVGEEKYKVAHVDQALTPS